MSIGRTASFLRRVGRNTTMTTLIPRMRMPQRAQSLLSSSVAELDKNALRLAQNVAAWTIRNLRDSRGFFYYQRRRFYTVRKPYMRWTQAWMLYALARLLEATKTELNADRS